MQVTFDVVVPENVRFLGYTVNGSIKTETLGADVEAGRRSPLPRTVRLGAAVRRTVAGLDVRLLGEVREREERRTGGVGLEVVARHATLEAALRVGYETRASAGDVYSPLVVGGGVALGPLAVDLAWRALGPLGSTGQLGVRYLPGRQ